MANDAIQKVVLEKIVRPTPIISNVVSYIDRDGMTEELIFHIVSDCGEMDTIVEFLARRATDDLLEAVLEEGLPVDDVVFLHSGSKDDPPPTEAFTIYKRD